VKHTACSPDGPARSAQVHVVAERTEVNRGPSADDAAELLREQGNEAYRYGQRVTHNH
jgi:hypothetical protein